MASTFLAPPFSRQAGGFESISPQTPLQLQPEPPLFKPPRSSSIHRSGRPLPVSLRQGFPPSPLPECSHLNATPAPLQGGRGEPKGTNPFFCCPPSLSLDITVSAVALVSSLRFPPLPHVQATLPFWDTARDALLDLRSFFEFSSPSLEEGCWHLLIPSLRNHGFAAPGWEFFSTPSFSRFARE